jgi:hypothetical protein
MMMSFVSFCFSFVRCAEERGRERYRKRFCARRCEIIGNQIGFVLVRGAGEVHTPTSLVGLTDNASVGARFVAHDEPLESRFKTQKSHSLGSIVSLIAMKSYQHD